MRYILMTLVVVSQLAYGQSIWDSAHLALVKQNLQLPVLYPGIRYLNRPGGKTDGATTRFCDDEGQDGCKW